MRMFTRHSLGTTSFVAFPQSANVPLPPREERTACDAATIGSYPKCTFLGGQALVSLLARKEPLPPGIGESCGFFRSRVTPLSARAITRYPEGASPQC